MEITPVINEIKGPRHDKKDRPYTVAPWRMIKKEDTVTNNGKTYYWCTRDHYSGGVKHNGMYADHKSCDHEAWQARINTNHTNACANNGKAPVEAPKSEEAPTQKLALNNKLCNAFCTQAGLSAEAIDRIWQDAQGNE